MQFNDQRRCVVYHLRLTTQTSVLRQTNLHAGGCEKLSQKAESSCTLCNNSVSLPATINLLQEVRFNSWVVNDATSLFKPFKFHPFCCQYYRSLNGTETRASESLKSAVSVGSNGSNHSLFNNFSLFLSPFLVVLAIVGVIVFEAPLVVDELVDYKITLKLAISSVQEFSHSFIIRKIFRTYMSHRYKTYFAISLSLADCKILIVSSANTILPTSFCTLLQRR